MLLKSADPVLRLVQRLEVRVPFVQLAGAPWRAGQVARQPSGLLITQTAAHQPLLLVPIRTITLFGAIKLHGVPVAQSLLIVVIVVAAIRIGLLLRLMLLIRE